MTREFTLRCRGEMDLRVSAPTKRLAIQKLNRMFSLGQPDPLSGKQITNKVRCLGFFISEPALTKEVSYDPIDPCC